MNIKNLSIILISFLLVLNLNAQERLVVDSLKSAITAAKQDTTKIHQLLKLADVYSQFHEDTTILYLKQALHLARELDSPLWKARIFNELGIHYAFKSEFFKALEHIDLAENILSVFPNDSIRANVHTNKAIVFININRYSEAEYQAAKALELFQKLDAQKGISTIYNMYSVIFNKIGEQDKALYYILKSYRLDKKINNESQIPASLHNLSGQYYEMGQLDSAFFYLRQSIALNLKNDNQIWLAGNYLNLGEMYFGQQQLDSAEIYLGKAAKRFRSLGYTLELSNIELSKAKIDLARSDTMAAIRHYETVLNAPDEQTNLEYRTQAYKELASIAQVKRQYEKAYTYYTKYNQLDDSLKQEKNTSLVNLLEMRMDYEQQKNNMEFAKQEVVLKSQRKNTLIIILGSIVLFVILIAFFFIRLQQTKALTLKLKQENLKKELDYKNQEMASNVMALMKKNEILGNISKELLQIGKDTNKTETKTAINKIAQRIRATKDVELWEEFNVRFNQVHHEFYDRLNEKYPDLSPAEQRLCAFLKMNMNTKDISELTGNAVNSINTTRYRIRKKMGLTEGENLVNMLMQL